LTVRLDRTPVVTARGGGYGLWATPPLRSPYRPLRGLGHEEGGTAACHLSDPICGHEPARRRTPRRRPHGGTGVSTGPDRSACLAARGLPEKTRKGDSTEGGHNAGRRCPGVGVGGACGPHGSLSSSGREARPIDANRRASRWREASGRLAVAAKDLG
jgi:hypothetical protein